MASMKMLNHAMGVFRKVAMFRRGTLGVVIFAALALCLAGCTSRDSGKAPAGAAAESSTADPVEVAILTSQTGPLAAYGHQYLDGFKAGLDYATEGTGKVGGRKIAVTYVDDQGKPATAVARFKGLVGKGYRIIAGTASSGVALRLAPLAAQNKVLYIAGPVAADKITGINKMTFRSGRQSWQDVETAKSLIGDAQNQKVVVFAQDYAFGKANVAAVQKVLGGAGAHVSAILVPLSTTDFTPFALKVKQAQPDLLFVAWAGASTASVW
jgi:branched-chain amino acid transport system substrate-binding protein